MKLSLSLCKSPFTSSVLYVDLTAHGITIWRSCFKCCFWSNTFPFLCLLKASQILQNVDKFQLCFSPLKKIKSLVSVGVRHQASWIYHCISQVDYFAAFWCLGALHFLYHLDCNTEQCFNSVLRLLITWTFHLALVCTFEHIGCRVFTWWLHYMGLSILCDE